MSKSASTRDVSPQSWSCWRRCLNPLRLLSRWPLAVGFMMIMGLAIGWLASWGLAPAYVAQVDLLLPKKSDALHSTETEALLIASRSMIDRAMNDDKLRDLEGMPEGNQDPAGWVANHLRVTALTPEVLRVEVTTHYQASSDAIALALVMAFVENVAERQPAIASGSELAKPSVLSMSSFAANPSRWWRLFQGLAIGGCLGLLLAMFLEATDTRYTGRAEFEYDLGLPIAAYIPKHSLGRLSELRGEPPLITLQYGRNVVCEDYRRLRSWLLCHRQFGHKQTLLVASALHSEGKTTLAANLAVTYAQLGKRVLLIDAAGRDGTMERYFGVDNSPGLTELLRNLVSDDEAIRASSVRNLHLLPRGKSAPIQGDYVGSLAFQQLLNSLKQQFDLIIIDSPPILGRCDAGAMSAFVDGVLLVNKLSPDTRSTLPQAVAELRSVNANLLGVVVNGVRMRPHESGYWERCEREWGRPAVDEVDLERTWLMKIEELQTAEVTESQSL